MQVVLVMFRGSDRRSFSLTRDITVIGRREDCDFRIPLSEISRKHCRLIKEDDTVRVEDLGSSNGTYVNGVRVQEATLQPGDTLKFGSIVFVVQIDGVPADADLHPATESHAATDSVGGSSAMNSAVGGGSDMSTEGHLNPTAQSEVGSEVDDSTVGRTESVGGNSFIITDDAPADSSAGEYDPMSILSGDPEDSAHGQQVGENDIADDILMDLEAQDRPTSS